MFTPQQADGYYDEDGRWVITKYCLVSCGERCTCKPPNGQLIKPGSRADKAIIEIIKRGY